MHVLKIIFKRQEQAFVNPKTLHLKRLLASRLVAIYT